jgi:hypothetical protein
MQVTGPELYALQLANHKCSNSVHIVPRATLGSPEEQLAGTAILQLGDDFV